MDTVSSTYEINGVGISFYPNPVEDQLFIAIDTPKTRLSYQVLDLNGQLIKKASLVQKSIDLKHFKSGLYFIKILDNENRGMVSRIIKI